MACVCPSVEIDPKKFDYLFGRAGGNDHNLKRTNQLAVKMKRLGIFNDNNGRKILSDHLTETAINPTNVIGKFSNEYGNFVVKESFLMGPSGKATVFHTTYRVSNDGMYTYITTIPKNGG